MTTLEAKAGLTLPQWAEELKRRYLRGEATQFVLHGNVHDLVLSGGAALTLSEFLAQVLLEKKDNVVLYNVSTGARFARRKMDLTGHEELLLKKDPASALPALEKVLATQERVAVVLEYAETIAPAADTAFSTVDDRAASVTLHRWSLLRALEKADSLVLLTLENLSDLHQKLVSNPRVATVQVPMPDLAARAAGIRLFAPGMSDEEVARLAEVTAGLKLIQIQAILAPADSDPAADREGRTRYLVELLAAGQPPTDEVRQRAEQLAGLTQGLSHEQIRKLIAPAGAAPRQAEDARAQVDRLVAARKREIIERECYGLIEFVTPQHGFEVVGGMDEVKKDLLAIADNIRAGRRHRVPMGLLFTGPMGTGKTFVAEAFARECGLTTVKLKNFRSKWVGATEGNLERILSVIQAIGQVIVIIDEGDRAFGNSEGGDGDGGTSSRVIARIKEFMSDGENRGRVLFILMTNRPDKLDIDIKRAGRLDRKIPFLYPQTGEEVARVLGAQLKKHKAKAEVSFPRDLTLAEQIVGYSNADIEAVVILSTDYAAEGGADAPVRAAELERAIRDYLPSRDTEMLEFMELLAVFEASNRRMLPKKYADLPAEALQARLEALRLQVGRRR